MTAHCTAVGQVPLCTSPGKKGAKLTPEEKKKLNKKQRKFERKKNAKINSLLEEQLQDKLLACIASKTAQCGRANGYVLEGKELEFYLGKGRSKPGKANKTFLAHVIKLFIVLY